MNSFFSAVLLTRKGTWFRAVVLGFVVWQFRFEVWGVGSRVLGFGFRVSSSGFKV